MDNNGRSCKGQAQTGSEIRGVTGNTRGGSVTGGSVVEIEDVLKEDMGGRENSP